MNSRQFQVNVQENADGTRIELVGWMDFATAAKFRSAMLKITHQKWTNVVLDCARLDYIDSAGMGNILYWRNKLQEQQCSITLENCTGPVLEAFRLGGFHKIFTMR